MRSHQSSFRLIPWDAGILFRETLPVSCRLYHVFLQHFCFMSIFFDSEPCLSLCGYVNCSRTPLHFTHLVSLQGWRHWGSLGPAEPGEGEPWRKHEGEAALKRSGHVAGARLIPSHDNNNQNLFTCRIRSEATPWPVLFSYAFLPQSPPLFKSKANLGFVCPLLQCVDRSSFSIFWVSFFPTTT